MNSEQCGTITTIVIIITILSITAIMITGIFGASKIQNVNAQKPFTVIPHNNIQIKVGGGNVSFPFFGYNPQKIQVKVGDSVTWIGTSMIEEPHTVSFVKDKALNTGPDVPFMVSNSSTFLPVPSNANSQPTIIPNNNTTNKNNNNNLIIIAGANTRTNLANMVDKNNIDVMIDPSKPVVMDGSEKFVNSGIIVAKKYVNIYPGSTDSFTLTFDKAGVYDYICLYHSSMGGQVVVK